jgi:hypothetical protein
MSVKRVKVTSPLWKLTDSEGSGRIVVAVTVLGSFGIQVFSSLSAGCEVVQDCVDL